MIAFYGMGGGFGHLTRIQTFIDNQSIIGPYKIITANPKARNFFPKDQTIMISADKSTTKTQLGELIQKACSNYGFEELYIDVFPCGIMGELTADTISHQKAHCLARHMDWETYDEVIDNVPSFETTFCFESLSSDHLQFINTHSKQIRNAELKYSLPSQVDHKILKAEKPIWLIVHTTNREELNMLIDHALDVANIRKTNPQLVVLSDIAIELPNEAVLIHDHRAIDWFPHAEKIFSAAGFNTWHQLRPWRSKHICIPFKRRYDDQFWRASQV